MASSHVHEDENSVERLVRIFEAFCQRRAGELRRAEVAEKEKE